VTIATFTSLLAGVSFAAIGLVPTIDANSYTFLAILALACELIFLSFYVRTGIDLDVVVDKLKASLRQEDADYIRAELDRLVELMLPHLGSKYSVVSLRDASNAFPHADIPEEYVARVTAYNLRRVQLFKVIENAREAAGHDVPILDTLLKALPTRITVAVLAFAIFATMLPIFFRSATSLATLAGLTSLAALLHSAVAAVAYVRAGSAHALSVVAKN